MQPNNAGTASRKLYYTTISVDVLLTSNERKNRRRHRENGVNAIACIELLLNNGHKRLVSNGWYQGWKNGMKE